VLLCVFGLVACDNTTIPAESVTLNKTTLTLDVDVTETLTATVKPDDATDKTVTWSSSNAEVVTVDTNGKVTAKAEGTAVITAKTSNGKSATCNVMVNDEPADTAQVTAAEWTEILDGVTKFTIEFYDVTALQMRIKIDGDLRSQGSGTREQIYAKVDNEYSQYNFNGTDWTKRDLTESDYTRYTASSASMLKFFKDDHELFTYDNGIYTATSLDKSDTMYSTLDNVQITFADGALVGMEFEIDGTTMKVKVSNVGTTTVTLPDDYDDQTGGGDTPAPGEVNETQWQAALDQSAFTAFSAAMTLTGYDITCVLNVDLANGKYYFTGTEGETYYSHEDDKYYKYTKRTTEEKFTRTEVQQENFDRQLRDLEIMVVLNYKGSFANATYDAQQDTYSATAVIHGGSYPATLRFSQGQLVYAQINMGFDDYFMTIEYAYETPTIVLPADFNDGGSGGGVEPQPTGNTVTQAQWEAALDQSAFTAFSAMMEETNDGSTVGNYNYKVDITAGRYYFSVLMNETYFSNEGEKFYNYFKGSSAEKFTKSEISEQDFTNCLLDLEIMSVLKCKGNFATAVYDNQTSTYSTTTQLGDGSLPIALKFEGGKLIYAQIDCGGGHHFLKIEYTYEKPQIELPTDVIDGGSGDEQEPTEVTAAQWTQIFNDTNNFTIELYQNNELSNTIKINGDLRSQSYHSSITIYAKVGSEYATYQYNGTTWTKTDLSEAEYNSNDLFASLPRFLKDEYESFSYNNGVYTAVSVDILDDTLKNIKVTFADGALVGVEFDMDVMGSFNVINIGTTELTLPTEYDDQTGEVEPQPTGNTVTQAQWEAALDQSAFTNFSYRATSSQSSKPPLVIKADLANDRYYDATSNEYYVLINEQCDYYFIRDGATKFIKRVIDQDNYHDYINGAMQALLFAGYYNDFDFDQSTSTYVSKGNLTIAGATYNAKLKFENGKLIHSEIELVDEGATIINDYTYGNVKVEVPTNYVDDVQKKIFNYVDMTGEGMDAATLEQYKNQFKNWTLIFEFGVRLLTAQGTVVRTGDYTFTGDTLTITFPDLTVAETTYNGSDIITLKIALDGSGEGGGSPTTYYGIITYKLTA